MSLVICSGIWGWEDGDSNWMLSQELLQLHRVHSQVGLHDLLCRLAWIDRQKTETTGTVVTLQPVIGRKVTEVNKIHVNPMSYYYVLIHFVYLLPWSHTLLLYNRPNRLDSWSSIHSISRAWAYLTVVDTGLNIEKHKHWKQDRFSTCFKNLWNRQWDFLTEVKLRLV